MTSALEGLPLAKLVYSGILLFLIGLAFAGIRRVWFDHKPYLQAFDYYKDGNVSAPAGAGFASQVLQRHLGFYVPGRGGPTG